MTHPRDPAQPRRGTLAGLALVFAVILSGAALAFSLMALHEARVARASDELPVIQLRQTPDERPLIRPKEVWA